MDKLKNFWPQHLMLCLGLCGLTNLWGSAFFGGRLLTVAFFILCTAAVILRNAVFPEAALAELNNAMGLASYTGMSCAGYFVSSWMYQWGIPGGRAVWLIFFIVNTLVFLRFVQLERRAANHFSRERIIPMWYFMVLYTGVAAIPLPSMDMPRTAAVLAVITLVNYVWLTPLVVYRAFWGRPLPAPLEPTKAIVMAAPSMTNVALMNAFGARIPEIIPVILVALGQFFFFYFFVYHARHFLRLPFGPAHCAFTFPFAICTASLMGFSRIYLRGTAQMLFRALALTEMLIATVIILTVLFLFLRHDTHVFRGTPAA